MPLWIKVLVEAGRTSPLARLTIISRKLPPSRRRRGLTSFQISGRTFLSLGLGRLAVRSAEVARPVPREGRSADFMPPPKLDGPYEEDILLEVYARAGFVTGVSSQIRQESLSMAIFRWYGDGGRR